MARLISGWIEILIVKMIGTVRTKNINMAMKFLIVFMKKKKDFFCSPEQDYDYSDLTPLLRNSTKLLPETIILKSKETKKR